MADFEKAFNKTFEIEGGLSTNKNDKGGVTNYGISLKFLKDIEGIDVDDLDKDGIIYEKVGDLNNDGKVDKDDIIALIPVVAKALYFKYFWMPIKGNQIQSQVIANQIFDIAVNSGTRKSIALLQVSLCDVATIVACDGVIGQQTLLATNTASAKLLNNALVKERIANYRKIIAADPTQETFKNGWFIRAAKYLI